MLIIIYNINNVVIYFINCHLLGYSKIFKFHLVLPSNLPPSHEVPFGHTRYKLEASYNGQIVIYNFSVNQWVGLEKRNDTIVSITVVPTFVFFFFFIHVY